MEDGREAGRVQAALLVLRRLQQRREQAGRLVHERHAQLEGDRLLQECHRLEAQLQVHRTGAGAAFYGGTRSPEAEVDAALRDPEGLRDVHAGRRKTHSHLAAFQPLA